MSLSPSLPSRTRQRMLDNPVAAPGVGGLATWAFGHIVAAGLLAIAPASNAQIITQGYKFLFVSLILCLLITLSRLRVPLRIAGGVIGLLAFQVWIFFCDFHAEVTLGKMSIFGPLDYTLMLYALYFIQSAVLVYYFPKARKYFIRLFLIIYSIAAIVAILQFFKVGPALAIGRYYNNVAELDNWNKKGGVRASGLFGWPHAMSLASAGAFAILASKLRQGKANAWQSLICLLPIMVGLFAQFRTAYITLIACYVYYLFLLYRRNKVQAIFLTAITAALATVVIVSLSDQFSYILSSQGLSEGSLQYRLNVGWPQAFKIFNARPWVGIGFDPEMVFITSSTQSYFVSGAALDSGLLCILAWSGGVGVALFLGSMILGWRGAGKILRLPNLDPDRAAIALFVIWTLICELNNMVNSLSFLDFVGLNMMIFIGAGLLMPSREEALVETVDPIPA